MAILTNILLVINVIVCLLIILLVLMQRPKNEGLGAAFGGGMTDNLFGAQTTNVLQTITRWLGGIFFALALILSWLYVQQGRQGGSSAVQRKLSAPAATLPPGATPPPVGAITGEDASAPPVPPSAPADTKLETAPANPEAASPAVPAPPAGTEAAPAAPTESTTAIPAAPSAAEPATPPAADPAPPASTDGSAPAEAPAAPATPPADAPR